MISSKIQFYLICKNDLLIIKDEENSMIISKYDIVEEKVVLIEVIIYPEE
jgi:hypothetical protein